MTPQEAKELFLEAQQEWCFQYVNEGCSTPSKTGGYIIAATFAEACRKLVVTYNVDLNGWSYNPSKGTPEEFVRRHAQGAVKIGPRMSHDTAWTTDLKGIWPDEK